MRAIEIKLSQGAKPGLGGLLPGGQGHAGDRARSEASRSGGTASARPATPRSATSTRCSTSSSSSPTPPACRSASSRAVGEMAFWHELADAMATRSRGVDFVTIDGGEGGTGAAPLVFADHVALPFKLGFARVYRDLRRARRARARSSSSARASSASRRRAAGAGPGLRHGQRGPRGDAGGRLHPGPALPHRPLPDRRRDPEPVADARPRPDPQGGPPGQLRRDAAQGSAAAGARLRRSPTRRWSASTTSTCSTIGSARARRGGLRLPGGLERIGVGSRLPATAREARHVSPRNSRDASRSNTASPEPAGTSTSGKRSSPSQADSRVGRRANRARRSRSDTAPGAGTISSPAEGSHAAWVPARCAGVQPAPRYQRGRAFRPAMRGGRWGSAVTRSPAARRPAAAKLLRSVVRTSSASRSAGGRGVDTGSPAWPAASRAQPRSARRSRRADLPQVRRPVAVTCRTVAARAPSDRATHRCAGAQIVGREIGGIEVRGRQTGSGRNSHARRGPRPLKQPTVAAMANTSQGTSLLQPERVAARRDGTCDRSSAGRLTGCGVHATRRVTRKIRAGTAATAVCCKPLLQPRLWVSSAATAGSSTRLASLAAAASSSRAASTPILLPPRAASSTPHPRARARVDEELVGEDLADAPGYDEQKRPRRQQQWRPAQRASERDQQGGSRRQSEQREQREGQGRLRRGQPCRQPGGEDGVAPRRDAEDPRQFGHGVVDVSVEGREVGAVQGTSSSQRCSARSRLAPRKTQAPARAAAGQRPSSLTTGLRGGAPCETSRAWLAPRRGRLRRGRRAAHTARPGTDPEQAAVHGARQGTLDLPQERRDRRDEHQHGRDQRGRPRRPRCNSQQETTSSASAPTS